MRSQKGLDAADAGNFPTEVCAHECRIGNNADAAEIESIGIEASSNRRIIIAGFLGVPGAGVNELGE